MKDNDIESLDYKDQPITQTLEKNYMPYVMSVIVSRAIPEIDGFKPSHRKILYTMYQMKLLKGNRTKSANVVGQTMKLNPHGDQAIYATLVRLTNGNEALLLPYIDSKGNFGKVTSRDMKFAAPRYTEVKLNEICEELFMDIDKNTVDLIDNYDGSTKEPVLLPTTFPNILANPNKGIAVGMASNFASFNLKELCEATIALIKNPNTDLIEIMPAPDFSTGGRILYDKTAMQQIYNTGVGSFKIRGKIHHDVKENMLIITEIPYTTTIEQIIDRIIELIKLGRIKEISDVRDETDLKGLKIAIDLKRGTDVEKLIAKIFRYTPLEDSFSCNQNLLIDGRPKVLGVREIILEWLKFRQNCIVRSAVYDIEKLSNKRHLLLGLQEVLLDIDETVRIIRKTEEEKQVIPNLMRHFSITIDQANFVADIKLRQLNREYILSRISEIESLNKEIERLNKLINDVAFVNQQIKLELKHIIKKYGKDRKTELLNPAKVIVHDETEQITDYNLKVFITAHQYIKKVSLVSLRSSGEHKLKEDDSIVQEIEGNNIDEILFFTNKCNVYKLKLHEIEDQKVSNLGIYLPNILELEDEEQVIYTVITSDFKGHMVFGYENGKVAKVSLEAYQTKTNRKKLVKAYSNLSKLVGILFIEEDSDLFAIREDHKGEMRALLFNSNLLSEIISKNTKGVQAIRLKKQSYMVSMQKFEADLIDESERYRCKELPKSGETVDPVFHMTFTTNKQ